MVSVLVSSVVRRGFIGGVTVSSVLVSSVVDRGLELVFYCFSTKHAALRRKGKD